MRGIRRSGDMLDPRDGDDELLRSVTILNLPIPSHGRLQIWSRTVTDQLMAIFKFKFRTTLARKHYSGALVPNLSVLYNIRS